MELSGFENLSDETVKTGAQIFHHMYEKIFLGAMRDAATNGDCKSLLVFNVNRSTECYLSKLRKIK